MPGVIPRSRPQRLAGLGGRNASAMKASGRRGSKRNNSECGCEQPTFETVDGAKICLNCGVQVSESNIVAEVTFGEGSNGAITVDGGQVHDGQRHAKTLGAAASRRIGASIGERQDAEQNGREAIRVFTGRLPIGQDIAEQAIQIWTLAAKDNFIQGRRADEVAGACLYAACRRDSQNTVLLMDVAELISTNVFVLGDTYKELCQRLFLEVKARTHVIEIEPLIMKYAAKLEFGNMTRAVAEDAVKIIRRMKRDWITPGRHPAGLCGACIILAARMNNFRRTVREVVFIVKVTDITIAKRLEEFKRTRSSVLSIQQFRSVGNRIKHQHDPPAYYEAEERAKKKEERKRKRQEALARGEAIDIADDESDVMSRQSSVAATTPAPEEAGAMAVAVGPAPADTVSSQGDEPPPSKKLKRTTATAPRPPRRDADGFVIPEVPIDPALLAAANAAARDLEEQADESGAVQEVAPQKKGPGRPRKDGKQKAPTLPIPALTPEELLEEAELQDEIDQLLRDDECIKAKDHIEALKIEKAAEKLAEEQRAIAAAANEQRFEQSHGTKRPAVSDSEIIGEDEFADDPEVMNALLTEAQVKIKEMIWVKHNEDWLRQQQTKQLKRALEDAEGKSREKKRRKRGRMGDGSVLEGGTPVESPADANMRMLEKRAGKGFSQRVNYAALGAIYNRSTPSASEAGTPAPESRAETPATEAGDAHDATPLRVQQPTPPTTQQATVEPQADKAAEEAGPEGDDDEEDEEEDWEEGPTHEDYDEDEEPDLLDAVEDVTGNFNYGSDDGGYESY